MSSRNLSDSDLLALHETTVRYFRALMRAAEAVIENDRERMLGSSYDTQQRWLRLDARMRDARELLKMLDERARP